MVEEAWGLRWQEQVHGFLRWLERRQLSAFRSANRIGDGKAQHKSQCRSSQTCYITKNECRASGTLAMASHGRWVKVAGAVAWLLEMAGEQAVVSFQVCKQVVTDSEARNGSQ